MYGGFQIYISVPLIIQRYPLAQVSIFDETLVNCAVECFFVLFCFVFYLGFLSRTSTIQRTAGEGGGYFFNSSLPLPPASQAIRHQLHDYCKVQHTGKVGLKTLKWDPGCNALGWGSKVGPQGRNLRQDLRVGYQDET